MCAVLQVSLQYSGTCPLRTSRLVLITEVSFRDHSIHYSHVLLYVYTGCQYWECYAAARKSSWGVFVWFSEWFSLYYSTIFVSLLSHCCLYLLTLHAYKYMLYCALSMYSVVCMFNIPLLRTGGLVARIPDECLHAVCIW